MTAQTKLKPVISASRRTDLPRFYYSWLQETLRAGNVTLPNPLYREKTYTVDLDPGNVHSLVLWSKDFSLVAQDPQYLENYHLYFQYTVNHYSPVLEPHAPSYRETLGVLEQLLGRYRPEQFNIRFDPIILSDRGEPDLTKNKPEQARLLVFDQLCRDLKTLGMTGCRITTSFVQLYRHVARRLANSGLDLRQPDPDQQVRLAAHLVQIASRHGFILYSCSSPLLSGAAGIQPGHCIDGELLENLFGGRVSRAKDSGQREACGCSKSRDIGSYDQPCRFGCVYCYSCKTL
ncbi:DUF1848 family protein [Acetonema longum]|uniref:DNA repair photolyase n=1 Tax=Acetonema longum DSM 6540 TaxID=1009370 RepID=F7NMU7_9FIRM|nr:DUF1848 family protein [Acetonema longum]EGO62641.1 hypothetical protein ALO_17141 [Acetonema longum DSM 6540]